MIAAFARDLRFGWKGLLRRPASAAAAILTGGLAAAACAALFSVLDPVYLRPLPFADGERLVMVWGREERTGTIRQAASYTEYRVWREVAGAFEELAASHLWRPTWQGKERSVPLTGARVSGSFFPLLGVAAQLGRTFTDVEVGGGATDLVVLSHRLWQRLGADPGLVGETLALDEGPFTVLGVMPPSFHLPTPMVFAPADLWAPWTPSVRRSRPSERYLRVLGRLAPGVGPDEARAEMAAIASRLAAQRPASAAAYDVTLAPVRRELVGAARPLLSALTAAVGAMLLLAWCNLAHFSLARAATRRRELAVRVAAGARRLRLAGQLTAEALPPALLGGGLGLVVAAGAIGPLASLDLERLPFGDSVRISGRVVVLTLALALATALVMGSVATLVLARLDVPRWLKEAEQGPSRKRSRGARGLLLVTETGLSLVLVLAATALLRTSRHLAAVEPGFAPRGVLAVRLRPPPAPPRQLAQRYGDLITGVSSLTGVLSAAVANLEPMDPGSMRARILPFSDGRAAASAGEPMEFRGVSPGYFRTLGIPLLAGRDFAADDGALAVAILSREAARRLFGTDPAVARRLTSSWGPPAPREVVGVVGDVRHRGLRHEAPPTVYFPLAQTPLVPATLVVRGPDEATAIATAVAARIRSLDRGLPIEAMTPLASMLAASTRETRLATYLVSGFALFSLVLVAGGTYGVVAHSTARRRHEIGLRLALGARREDLLLSILARGVVHTGIGVALGLAATVAAAPWLTPLLAGVSLLDPLACAAAVGLLAGVALLTTYLVARRMVRLEPAAALAPGPPMAQRLRERGL